MKDMTRKPKLVGDKALLIRLGLAWDMVDEDGGCDTQLLSALWAVCKGHPEYHIVTLIQDDDGDLAYVNRIAYVNRVGYWLATGDNDATLEV